ncbi:hypothetical protein MLD38_033070 [Melastoma candidum]|uniref:Uncharacterized protein n=1 Tax=Melastoma candidum TaxID=119954 RepID=A0ACB9M869_9MYRT|nr:hypothetical protein MLD38_033070 [Melastoma candidum]
MLYGYRERLAIAYGLLEDPNGSAIRVTKNLRVCGDCPEFCKLLSKVFGRKLIIEMPIDITTSERGCAHVEVIVVPVLTSFPWITGIEWDIRKKRQLKMERYES